jgi:DNA polymerase-1
MPVPPPAPRLFLVDGYALIYRAFFALLARPLTTARGENTSAAWGVANFLQRLQASHQPEYLGWVHDAGLSFRHERYPAYKATREKLNDELQDDFNRGMARISALLEAMRIPVLTCDGYEADDVIGTLAMQAVAEQVNVVVVSGDKDFQQLVQPGVWLLNPGRGGPASVEEQWVSVENGSERLGVAPEFVVDYLALVGDSSDNIPGVHGIGDKTASELVNRFGPIERILENVEQITKKRPREALLAYPDRALLSKELVTIRRDVPVTLDLARLKVREPDWMRLKNLYIELEFQGLAKQAAAALADSEQSLGTGASETSEAADDGPLPDGALDFPAPAPAIPAIPTSYVTVDTLDAMRDVIARARAAGTIALDTETVVDAASPQKVDALRSTIIGLTIATAPGEAFYLPLRHRERDGAQGDLLLDASGDRSPTDAPEDRGLVRGGDEPSPPPAKPAKKKKTVSVEPTSIAATAFARGAPAVRNLPALDSAEMAPLRALLEDPAVRKTAQNAKYDLLALRRVGISVRGLDFDTMLASYVLNPGRRSHGLDVLALEFLDHRMTSFDELCGKGRTAIPYDQVPIECARDYSCEEADMALRLRALFEPQLESQQLMRLLRDVELPLVEVLAEMEWVGVSINMPWFASLKTRFQAERERVEKSIHEVAGMEFNINSNPQLREILFEKLGLPVIKRTPTGPSTDASVLQELADEGHALPSLLMEYRELSKLESTYIDALPAIVNPRTGRIHTSFNQTVASSGRLSSSDPNLQNIPIRRELGRDIRRGVIPRKGWTFVSADYSQIELRLLAHLSHDPAFIAAFVSGADIHRQTASVIFDVPLEEVTSDMRGRAKTINFATIYGQGPHALSRQLGIAHAEAKEFIARYFERFQGVRRYLDSMVDLARSQGYVQTIFGRRRYIPELRDRNFNIRAFGERVATNSPIQGSAADLIKIAMIRIHRALQAQQLTSAMILQVHDELVFEASPDEVLALEALVRQEMEHAAELDVPLVVDIGTGENWLETKM